MQLDAMAALARDKSHHNDAGGGRFRNPWPSAGQGMGFFKAMKCFVSDFQSVDLNPSEGLPPLMVPDWEAIHRPLAGMHQQRVTWLGHATFLVQIDGFNILTDPLFTHRCSPISWIGPSRYTPLPPSVLLPASLPQIHLVIISHNHYDHTSTATMEFLHSRERLEALRAALPARATPETFVEASPGPPLPKDNGADASGQRLVDLQELAPHWLVPAGVGELLASNDIPASHIHELDWWDSQGFRLRDLQLGNGAAAAGAGAAAPAIPELVAVCLPCQHFSGRSLTDRNDTLWASWALIGPTQRCYFGGDTGIRRVPEEVVPCCSTGTPADFGIAAEEAEIVALAAANLPICPAFEEIGRQLGPFDLAMIPIGAYSPRWFMSTVHLNPLDAVLVHKLVRAKKSIGMHWGTFKLTDEPIWEPPRRLKREAAREQMDEQEFIVLRHGETAVI
jgi:N-acyl-phosphatidylethanolamine-hydrolysing phospholipase D